MPWLPSVAAIIPCFNARRFVADAVHSALVQTYPRVQIVVIDDGSTDRPGDVLRPFQDRIKFVAQPHQGLAAARNRGIAETEAELIALLDADDRWHQDKIRRQVAVLESRPECCLVYTARQLIDKVGEPIQEGTTWYPLPPEPVHGECLLELVRANRLMSSSVLFWRAALSAGSWFDQRLAACEDWDLWLRLAERYQIGYVDEPLTEIRVHDSNMTLDARQMYASSLQVWEQIIRRGQRKEAVALAQAILLPAAHREYEAGNISRARELYRACTPGLGLEGWRRYAVSLLPAPISNPVRALWQTLGTGETIAPVAEPRHRLGDSRRPNPRLAVVDDDDFVRKLIVDALADSGHEVDLAADGAEALRLCEQARYELILSDLRMPNMDGATLYEELRLRYGPSMPRMIFMTAHEHSLDYTGFLAVASVPVLSKPFSVEGLRSVVRQVLSEGAS